LIIKRKKRKRRNKNRMKKIFLIMLSIMFILSTSSIFAENNTAQLNDVHLHIFYGQGCPHCSQLRLFLNDIQLKYPSLLIYEHEVYSNNDERILFEQMSQNFKTSIAGVPTVFIDDKVIVGFSNLIGESIEEEIINCISEGCGNPEMKKGTLETIQMIGDKSPSEKDYKKLSQKLTIPLIISAAAVDAINPCAFAVLIILMTVALSIADKKRALRFGLAFTVSIYISYFLIGLGLFTALQATGLSHKFYILVTLLAVIIGLFNIKDYLWYGKGVLMEIPLSWRPAMKKVIRSATSPFGAFLVGFLVSLFELPCTGGPYIVILGLLANEVSRITGILYLLLYNLVFVAPLIALSIIIYKGISTTEKLENLRKEKIRLLHLIAGIIMLGIASAMIYAIMHGWV
jgi:cytochrome c biogenesis protein CcdA/glutaredoxin